MIIGSENSSNSQRLVEVGEKAGCNYVRLVEDKSKVDWSELEKVKKVGISAGASAPEILVKELVREI